MPTDGLFFNLAEGVSMSMTEEELERRRHVVGASEVGVLFGLPSFGGRTVSDLWFEKKFGTVRSNGTSEAAELGLKLEPIILESAEKRLGMQIVDRQKWVVVGTNGATLDGRVIGEGPIVEAKTSGIVGPSKLSEWGEDGSDEIPDAYLLQVQAQMLVTGADLAYLAALIGGRGFSMFEIPAAAQLQDGIRRKSEEFILSLQSDVAPAEPPQLDTLKRIRREPNKIVDIPQELAERFEEAKATAKESEEAKEAAQRALLAALGNAEGGRCRWGMFTYYEQTTHYKAKAASETTFRVLRFKKG